MSKVSKVPIVKVHFVIVGKDFDIHEFSEVINITPSETRTPEEWPKVIKNDENLPDDLKPRFEWSLSEEFEFCMEMHSDLQRVNNIRIFNNVIATLSGDDLIKIWIDI